MNAEKKSIKDSRFCKDIIYMNINRIDKVECVVVYSVGLKVKCKGCLVERVDFPTTSG